MSPILSSTGETVSQDPLLDAFVKQPFDHSNLGNTPLTLFLAVRIFDERDAYKEKYEAEILVVITKLCALAKTDKTAQKLLTTANKLTTNGQGGDPSNTPLMLLVKKVGHVEAVKLLLPFYTTKDEFMNNTKRKVVFIILLQLQVRERCWKY